MKILLDECVPAQLRNAFTGHEVSTVPQMGWAGIKTGKLLAAAVGAGFDLFILADKNLRYQQNLTGRKLAILELWTNHRPTLEKHFTLIRAAAESTSAVISDPASPHLQGAEGFAVAGEFHVAVAGEGFARADAGACDGAFRLV